MEALEEVTMDMVAIKEETKMETNQMKPAASTASLRTEPQIINSMATTQATTVTQHHTPPLQVSPLGQTDRLSTTSLRQTSSSNNNKLIATTSITIIIKVMHTINNSSTDTTIKGTIITSVIVTETTNLITSSNLIIITSSSNSNNSLSSLKTLCSSSPACRTYQVLILACKEFSVTFLTC